MRLHLTDTAQGRRIETDSVVYPGAGDGANDITPAGLSEGMFFVPGLYGAERYDSSWRTVEKVPVDYDGADSQAAAWSWNADKAAEAFRPFVQKRLDEVLGRAMSVPRCYSARREMEAGPYTCRRAPTSAPTIAN